MVCAAKKSGPVADFDTLLDAAMDVATTPLVFKEDEAKPRVILVYDKTGAIVGATTPRGVREGAARRAAIQAEVQDGKRPVWVRCTDCDAVRPHPEKGPIRTAIRCSACTEKAKRPKTVLCADCGMSVEVNGNSPPKRCKSCKKKASNEASHARYVANPHRVHPGKRKERTRTYASAEAMPKPGETPTEARRRRYAANPEAVLAANRRSAEKRRAANPEAEREREREQSRKQRAKRRAEDIEAERERERQYACKRREKKRAARGAAKATPAKELS